MKHKINGLKIGENNICLTFLLEELSSCVILCPYLETEGRRSIIDKAKLTVKSLRPPSDFLFPLAFNEMRFWSEMVSSISSFSASSSPKDRSGEGGEGGGGDMGRAGTECSWISGNGDCGEELEASS